MRRLLVPVDGSDASVKAAEFAASLVRDAGGEVTLLYVYDLPTASAMGLAGLMNAEVDAARARMAQTCFTRAKQAMGDIQPVACLVEIGHPAEEITTAATKNSVSEIVMGSRGRAPVKSMLLGSVSERVVRTAHCPVTIVR